MRTHPFTIPEYAVGLRAFSNLGDGTKDNQGNEESAVSAPFISFVTFCAKDRRVGLVAAAPRQAELRQKHPDPALSLFGSARDRLRARVV